MDAYLYEVGSIVALSSIGPLLAATLIYGFGSAWYRSLLGVVMFALFVALDLLVGLFLVRRLVGDYENYGLVSLVVYSYVALAMWAVFIILIRERRGRD